MNDLSTHNTDILQEKWKKGGFGRKLAFVLAGAAAASGIATVSVMTGFDTKPDPDPEIVLLLLYLDAFFGLLLGIVIARRLVALWLERRKGQAGSGLHSKLVVMFGLVSAMPAILVALFSFLFLNFGIQTWFSDKVKTALEASHAAASAYLHEHKQNIRADALLTANDLNKEAPKLTRNQALFNKYLSQQAGLRSLSEAIVIDGDGRVLARSRFSQSLEFDLVPHKVLTEAATGVVVILTSDADDRVRAVVRLNRFIDAYLLVGRFVDPQVLDHIVNTRGAVDKYNRLEEKQEGIQFTFAMIFGVVAMLLLLTAVWIGLTLAGQLSSPLSSLIKASENVRDGDLSVRVDESSGKDEIGALGRAFNRMTSQLESQQKGLIEVNRQLDERRRFTETVLAGVSAGVIGLDEDRRIHLPNRSASELLGIELEKYTGRAFIDVIPEMADVLMRAVKRPSKQHQEEIRIDRNGQQRILMVTSAAERLDKEILGYVVTFDDVTELFSAQRKAAWADVARRIAHEIKNPLTPIQLSAERLKRKYLKQITTDPETFSACTDTIVRQVEDIGQLVDEFSSFARMPQAVLKPENIAEICRQVLFLESNRQTDINYTLDVPEKEVIVACDSSQIGQALTNLLKNAEESIMDNENGENKGNIHCLISQFSGEHEEDRVAIIVEDDGKGLPNEDHERLTEPYFTSRTNGTGLGLAIVRKVMEDHDGDLILKNRAQGGAKVSLVFNTLEDAFSNTSNPNDNKPEMVNHGT